MQAMLPKRLLQEKELKQKAKMISYTPPIKYLINPLISTLIQLLNYIIKSNSFQFEKFELYYEFVENEY